MQKTYVLDANVLIQAPYALESFEDNHIVLPLAVLEELDSLQGADGEQGANVRQVIRFLERQRLRGSLVEGVELPGGGTLRLEINHVPVSSAHAPVYEGDIFTVRGMGRFKLEALGGKSRKDRLFIQYFQY